MNPVEEKRKNNFLIQTSKRYSNLSKKKNKTKQKKKFKKKNQLDTQANR
jgi:hypothetical protein